MKFWDRLYSTSLKDLPDSILPGRFSLGAGGALINGSPYPEHTQLHYGLNGNLHLIGKGGDDQYESSIMEELLPTQLMRSAISEVIPELFQLDSLNNEVIKDFVPLVPRVNERIQKTDFELSLSNKIGFLEEVCRDPITLLKIEVERVHTDRARRIPPEAVEYLASHAEDWSRRTLTGVEPERVLSEIINDDYNIYENRVAATLIDRLYVYLLKRIHEVEELKATLKEKSQIEENSLNSWHRNRVYSLWGDSVSEDADFIAENTLQYLQGLARRIGKLMDSMLYKSIPARQRSEDSIVDTNIIANEQNYREVALLLSELNAIVGTKVQKSEAEIYMERLSEINSFEGFSYLLVLRVLVEFGYALKKQVENKSNPDTLAFTGAGLPDIAISREKNGTLRLQTLHTKDIIVVPLFAQLSGLSDTSNRLNDQTSAVKPIDGKARHNENTVLLFPDNSELPLDKLESIPHLSSGVSGILEDRLNKITPIHVSPFSFYNIERIGLCLRKWIFGSTYCDYPREVIVKNSLKKEVNGLVDCLEDQHISGVLHLSTPISAREVSQLTKHLNGEIKRSEGMGRDYITRKRDLEKMLQDIAQIEHRYEDLLSCPVCHTIISDREFTNTGQNTYRCHCSNCGTVWGLDACAHCKQSFPFIRTDSDSESRSMELFKTPERRIGLDGIALPCCTDEMGMLHLTCSKCGHCSKHGVNHFQEAS